MSWLVSWEELYLTNRAAGVLLNSCMFKLCRELLVGLLPSFPAQIDLAIDGADEVDADLNLIKGGG